MALRFQLLNDSLGPLILEKADPVDINALTQTIKRSEGYDGIIYEIILDVEFIKDGREYIKAAYENYGGIDAQVNVNIYERDPNLRRWVLYTTGQINFNKYDLYEDKVVVAIEQTGFQRKVLNLIDTDVDLLTRLTPIDVLLQSKTIVRSLNVSPNTTSFTQNDVLGESFPHCITPGGCTRTFGEAGVGQIAYGNIDMQKQVAKEFDEFENLSWGYNTDEPVAFLIAAEDGMIPELSVSLKLKHTLTESHTGDPIFFCGPSNIGNKEVKAWFIHKDKQGNVINSVDFGTWDSNTGCGSTGATGDFETKTYSDTNITITKGDQLFVFFTFRVYGDYVQLFSVPDNSGSFSYHLTVDSDIDNTWIRFSVNTTFSDTSTKAIFIHEVCEKLIEAYTGQSNAFKSNLLGRTDIGYDSDGEYSKIVITNGAYIAGRIASLSDPLVKKSIFANFKDILEFINSVACASFGFELDENGNQIVRLEKKSYFYQKDTKIISLGKVYNVKKSLDPKRYYNQIELGFPGQLNIGEVNAADEFNTVRRFSIPIINTKNKLTVSTKMRASGYQIEFQRRLAGTTKDSNLDDQNFAIVVIEDGMGGWKNKRNEGYDSITNVIDPETGYNFDLSPARSLQNWLQFISSSLIRSSDKSVKFAYGEVNYFMISKKTGGVDIAENGNFDTTFFTPIFDPELYTFEAKLTRQQVALIKANPYGYIEFEDLLGNVMSGFIDIGIDNDSNKNLATFNLLKRN